MQPLPSLQGALTFPVIWTPPPFPSLTSIIHNKLDLSEIIKPQKYAEGEQDRQGSIHTKLEGVSTPNQKNYPHQTRRSIHTKPEGVSTPNQRGYPHQTRGSRRIRGRSKLIMSLL